MSDLVTWLRARLDEDENLARESFGDHNWDRARALVDVEAKRRILDLHQRVDRRPDWVGGFEEPACYGCHADFQEEYYEPDANNCEVARLLALPYADEPGYDESWRP